MKQNLPQWDELVQYGGSNEKDAIFIYFLTYFFYLVEKGGGKMSRLVT